MELAYNIMVVVWGIVILLYFAFKFLRYQDQLSLSKLLTAEEERATRTKLVWLFSAFIATSVLVGAAAHRIAHLLFPAAVAPYPFGE